MKWPIARVMLWVALAAIVPAQRTLAKGIDDFTLAGSIPADAFLTIQTRGHSGQDFVNKMSARLWDEVEKARLDRDLKRVFKAMQHGGGGGSSGSAPAEAAEDPFEAQWQQIVDLCTAVEWANLGSREYAMGMKIGFPTIEFVCLMMPPEGKSADTFKALSGVVETLVKLSGGAVSLATDETGGDTIHRISINGAQVPVSFTLGLHKDVILAGFGGSMVEQSLALLQGQDGKSIAKSERYLGAFKKLPPPADSAVFFDVDKLMSQLRNTVAAAMEMIPPAAEGSPEAAQMEKVKALPGKIFDAFDFCEYAATVATTEGMKTNTESYSLLKADAKSKPGYVIFMGNPPLKDPLKMIPKEAGDFSVYSGINLIAAYDFAMKLLQEDIPDGEEAITQINGFKEELGFDIRDDLLAIFGGKMVSVSIPGPKAYSPADWCMGIELGSTEKMQSLIDKLVAEVEPHLAQQNGSMADANIEGAPGFRAVIVPSLALVGLNKPVFGIKDGMFYFASSGETVTRVLDAASGKSGNVGDNERFKNEGIPPKGDVISISFSDLTKLGESLGQVLSMAPMIMMMAPEVGKDPAAQAGLSMIGKLGRVVRKLDFLQSKATCVSLEGNAVVTRSVTNYREPPVKEKPGSASEAKEEGKAEEKDK